MTIMDKNHIDRKSVTDSSGIQRNFKERIECICNIGIQKKSIRIYRVYIHTHSHTFVCVCSLDSKIGIRGVTSQENQASHY